MTAADQILLALDANDCLARGGRAFAGGVKFARPQQRAVSPLMGAEGASFGWSGSDLSDAITNWQKRMGDLAANYAKLTPSWRASDPVGFADFTNDLRVLQSRYAPALANAQSVASSIFGMGTDAAYDALAKAMRVSYPPDGGPVSKGDYDDLYARLAAAARAAATPLTATPLTQPTGMDLGMAFFKATAPLDVIAMSTGEQKPSGPFGALAPQLKWITDHYKGLLYTTAVIVGGVLVLQLWPALMMPVKAAKGLAAAAAV